MNLTMCCYMKGPGILYYYIVTYILAYNVIKKTGALRCTHFSVSADRYQPHNRRSEHVYMGNCWRSHLTKGTTVGVLVSDESGTGHTLGYTE